MNWTTTQKVVVGIVLALVVGGIIVGVLAGMKVGVFKSSKRTMRIAGNTGANKRNQNKSIASDCRAATTEEIAAMSLQAGTEYKLCEFKNNDFTRFDDEEEYQFVRSSPPTTADSFPFAIFMKRGAGDLITPLDDISGQAYSLVLQFESDFFSNGFAKSIGGGDNDPETMAASIAALPTALPEAHVLSGLSPLSEVTTEAQIKFRVSQGATITVEPLPTSKTAPVLTGDKLNGAFRMALEYLDYQFKLDGKECKIRVIMAQPNTDFALMGVKQVWDSSDNTFKYYDPIEDKLVSEPNENVWSFWNQSKYMNENNGGDGNEDAQSLPLRTLFQKYRMPMPLDVVNASVDFADFKTKNATITLLVGGIIGFRDAKTAGFTEATLATNPIEQLKRFDLNTLQLQGVFSFA